LERIADADEPLLVARREACVYDGASRALVECRCDESVSVAIGSTNGDEAFARRKAAAVDREATDRAFARAEARAARRVNDLA
jgi:hypothetical protein